MSRNQTAVAHSQAAGETYRVARQRIADAHVSVVAFLNDDDYGNADTLPFIRPIAAALAQAGRRVLLVTDSGITAQVAFKPLWERLVPGEVQPLTRNVDLLMIPADLDFNEFQTLELLQRHRDSGAYTPADRLQQREQPHPRLSGRRRRLGRHARLPEVQPAARPPTGAAGRAMGHRPGTAAPCAANPAS